MEPMYQLTVGGSFRASHFINFPPGPEPLHEHEFRVQFFVRGPELDETGLLLDFFYLRRILEEILQPLQGANLNELPPFASQNTSAENLARYLFEELGQRLKKDPVRLSGVRVWDTPESCASYSEFEG